MVLAEFKVLCHILLSGIAIYALIIISRLAVYGIKALKVYILKNQQ